MHLWRGRAYLLRGELLDAEADLRTAMSEFELYGYGANAMTYAGAFLALVRLEQATSTAPGEALALGAEAGERALRRGSRSIAARGSRCCSPTGATPRRSAAADALRVRQRRAGTTR